MFFSSSRATFLFFIFALQTTIGSIASPLAVPTHASTIDDNSKSTYDTRIGFGSCNRNDKESIWHIMSALHPDQLILLGDNMYADKKIRNFKFKQAVPSTFTKEYDKLGSDPEFLKLIQGIGGMDAVFATYDDHDYGINNGDRTYIYRDHAMDAFKKFFGNSSYGKGSSSSSNGGVGDVDAIKNAIKNNSSLHSNTHTGTRSTTASERYPKPNGVYSSTILEIPLKQQPPSTVSATGTDSLKNNEGESEGESIDVARVKIILLDVRYNKQSESGCSILGEDQWAWLQQELDSSIYHEDPMNEFDASGLCSEETSRNSNSDSDGNQQQQQSCMASSSPSTQFPVDLILLGSGTQILPQGKMIEESWDKDCPTERERLLTMLSTTVQKSRWRTGITPAATSTEAISSGSDSGSAAEEKELDDYINILLLSGDVHGAEVAQAFCNVQNEPASDAGSSAVNSAASRYLYHLFEFTASGFTHTFTHDTLDRLSPAAATSDQQVEAIDRALGVAAEIKDDLSRKGQIQSRGWLSEVLYDLYRAFTPQYYMEDRVTDHYHKPHLGILDLSFGTGGASGSGRHHRRRYKKVQARMQIVNYVGDTVMDRRVDSSNLLFHHSSDSRSAGTGATSIGAGVCTLFWGDVPAYKLLALRAAAAFVLLVFVVLPIVIVLWLVGASIFYIFIGAELSRRNKILDRNDQIEYAKKMGHPIPASLKEEEEEE